MADTDNDNNKIQNLIFDTNDAFITTAKCLANFLTLREFEIDQSLLNFGGFNHLISGYNCNALGNEESFTIENFMPDALPDTDIIFRMRKQFIEISEHTLREYYQHERIAK